ncbi:hypothetical protein ACJX0J_028830, partial [Zea mays]
TLQSLELVYRVIQPRYLNLKYVLTANNTINNRDDTTAITVTTSKTLEEGVEMEDHPDREEQLSKERTPGLVAAKNSNSKKNAKAKQILVMATTYPLVLFVYM